jgi:hypothetical protein
MLDAHVTDAPGNSPTGYRPSPLKELSKSFRMAKLLSALLAKNVLRKQQQPQQRNEKSHISMHSA